MIFNPVYEREKTVSARSIKLPLIVAGFNLILAAFALFSLLAAVTGIKRNGTVDYQVFLDIFRYVATIEFALMLFVMPAVTAGSISSEREQRTLDLMLTTKLKPAEIVTGKLLISLSSVGIMILSSLPILTVIFVYGGLTLKNIVLVFVCFSVAALFSSSVGIWASAISEKTGVATAVSYVLMLLLVGGTIGLRAVGGTGSALTELSGIMLLNPAATFYAFLTGHSVLPGVAVQLVLSLIFIFFSVRHIRS